MASKNESKSKRKKTNSSETVPATPADRSVPSDKLDGLDDFTSLCDFDETVEFDDEMGFLNPTTAMLDAETELVEAVDQALPALSRLGVALHNLAKQRSRAGD